MKKYAIHILSLTVVVLVIVIVFLLNTYVAPGHDGFYLFEAMFISVFMVALRFLMPIFSGMMMKKRNIQNDDNKNSRPETKDNNNTHNNGNDYDNLTDEFEDFTSMWMD